MSNYSFRTRILHYPRNYSHWVGKMVCILKFVHLFRYLKTNYWIAVCFQEMEYALDNCHHQLPGAHLHLVFHAAGNITLDFAALSLSLSLSLCMCLHDANIFPHIFTDFPSSICKFHSALTTSRFLRSCAFPFRSVGCTSHFVSWSEQLMKDEKEKKTRQNNITIFQL